MAPKMLLDSLTVNEVFLGNFRLDGGAMFGIVPKTLWSQKLNSDAENRVPLALRCLLVESKDKKILIDTGMGSKWSTREAQIYDVPQVSIPQELAKSGLHSVDEITHVFLTHLHFDHAGGMTYLDSSGKLMQTFPNAQIYLQKSNLLCAQNPNPREKASYRSENWLPYLESPRLHLLDTKPLEWMQVLPEISVLRSDGHTLGQQLILLAPESSEPVLFCGDLVPTTAHIPISWVMGYDINPVLLMQEKQKVLQDCVNQNWSLCFEHDPKISFAKIKTKTKSSGFFDFELSQDLTETFRSLV